MLSKVVFSLLLLGQPNPAGAAAADENILPVDPFSYTYNPFGKRDPFESFIKAGDNNTTFVSNDPLQNYDLAKFQLKGVVYGMANPRAIVIDGAGKGHIILRGTRIGRNQGRVVRILKDRVVVAERFRDPLGKLIVAEYSMVLNPKDLEN